MSRYDGLIIPRSYSEYINKTDAATLQQALQLPGVLSEAVASGDNKAVKSSAVNNALADKAEYQNQNVNVEYVNSSNNKYLVIQRHNVSKIYYFCSEAYILIDDAGNKIYFLTYIRNDDGVTAKLTTIAGDLFLSIYKVSEEYCVLQTNANWPKKYTVYSLNGYKPQIYATSVSPL